MCPLEIQGAADCGPGAQSSQQPGVVKQPCRCPALATQVQFTCSYNTDPGPQSRMCSSSGPLQKRFADPQQTRVCWRSRGARTAEGSEFSCAGQLKDRMGHHPQPAQQRAPRGGALTPAPLRSSLLPWADPWVPPAAQSRPFSALLPPSPLLPGELTLCPAVSSVHTHVPQWPRPH